MNARFRQTDRNRLRFAGFVLTSGLALLLNGCALSDPPDQATIVSGALPKTTTIPPEWLAESTTGEVGDNWLKTFNDPGLNAVVAEAIANNPDLHQAAARVEESRQMAVLVGSRLMPQVGLDLGLATTVHEDNTDWYNSGKALVGVAWEPDVWGKLRSQRESSEASYRATALDYSFARQSLAATVAKSWYLAIEANQLLEMARQTVDIYADLLNLAEVRQEAGKVSDLDVSEASANYHAALGGLNEAEGVDKVARRNLEVLLGRYPAAELAVAEDFAIVPPPIATSLPLSLLQRRPDLVAAEQQVLAAFRGQEAARLATLPGFSIGLDGGLLGDNILSILGVNPWMINAGVGMTVPIYTGGALKAKLEIATARQQGTIAGYGATVLNAFKEVENNLMGEVLYAKQLELDRNVVADRIESVRIARLQYEAGSIDLLQLLQLQAAQIDSQVEVIKLQNARLANRIDLHLALGGSFDETPAVVSIASTEKR